MSCSWLLVLFSHVVLLLACPGLSRCALDYPSFTDNSDPQSEHYDKRNNDIDYDSFIGLMGRRSAGTNRDMSSPFRPNMNDIFVGLLGRRNIVSAIPAWRRERRGSIFSKERRLKFCCGV
ncbi:tachykinin-3b isoform X1 [Megalobrama amblycephala]|uniref:tachykinin-3b isoform X1 n=2 Tax=Megalobrama amblycephala TaxID=75352 RepID=UPI0020146BD5|nr:tachykinin-3b isoform X1 [Megalobrama amblycephala]XP_048055261.1 tachykinin-3b isoform X1 [Megalobrama amblycephala]